MTWLTWRQHRMQAGATAAFVAGLGALLLLLGRGVYDVFRDSGLAACIVANRECELLERAFETRYGSYQFLMVFVLVCPLLVGLFWGAPLVAREFEQGTHQLVWTQGVTRRRWVLTKLAMTVPAVLAAGAAFALVSSWFAHPFNEAFGARLDYGVFDVQGIVPVAYTFFAFAVGVAAGAVVRKTVPAMAVTLLTFVATRLLFDGFARLRLLPTRVVSYATFGPRPASAERDLVLSSRVLRPDGSVLSSDGTIRITPGEVQEWCPGLAGGAGAKLDAVEKCLANLGFRTVDVVHPASQFWSFQVIETLLFGAAGAALLGFAVWWVLRKVT